MVAVPGYHQFDGRLWQIGALYDVLAYQNIVRPDIGGLYSESLLFGLSGGIGVSYFVFEYQGHDPNLYIGTRLSEYFSDPLAEACRRIGITPTVRQTTSAKKAIGNLKGVLKTGIPAIVWADATAVGDHILPDIGGPWMTPLVVFDYDEESDAAQLAGRASIPLRCTTGTLAEARAAQGSLKHKQLTVDTAVEAVDLPAALREAVDACLTALVSPPEKWRGNFGLPALAKWADLLTDSKNKRGWARLFPAGSSHYSALVSAFAMTQLAGTGGSASRRVYAEFLDEASAITGNGRWQDAANQFRVSAERWDDLALALLPDSITPLAETREILLQRERLFIEQGQSATEELQRLDDRLRVIKMEMASDFPMSEADVDRQRQVLRDAVLAIHAVESAAVELLALAAI